MHRKLLVMLRSKLFTFLLAFLFLVNVKCDLVASTPKVTLPHGGILVGSFMKTVNGNSIKAFRGIPYAEPPIGELRFKSPVPVKPWTGEKIADKDGINCLSQNPYERIFETIGDEDCLFLNVFVPEIKADHGPLSVMVYFHGGGWITGVGDSNLYGPQRLLDNDIIYVNGNYRLGALGFMSTGTEDCPGNFGFKDQVLMLKWVQKNIASFGGNPNDVTIFGESAGGGSVGYHIYSPMSKGLFHKAILQSGTNFNEWALGDRNIVVERAKKIGKILECPIDDNDFKPMIDCIRTKPAKHIASIVKEFYEFDTNPPVLFQAVLEPLTKEAFLTESPKNIDVPPSVQVPVMIGVTSEEGALMSGSLLHLKKDDFIAEFDEALAAMLLYSQKPKHVQEKITKAIDEFYFKGNRDFSKENHHNLTNLITDNLFLWGQDKFLRHRFSAAEKSEVGPTYLYLFDHRGPRSTTEFYHAGNEYYGVCHTDDLLYLFFYKIPNMTGGPNDQKMLWAMPYLWTNFAKTGNPTPDGSEITKWTSTNKFPLNYAHIGRQTTEDWTLLSNEVGFFEDRVEFWRGLEKVYDGE